MRDRARNLLAAALLMAGAPGPLAGQQSDGVITGLVVDAGSGSPLGGALVVLEAAGDAALLQPGAGGLIVRGLSAVTAPDGSYRLQGLLPGNYRLFVRHLGYREAAVEVGLTPSTFQVSIGLIMNPILLEPIGVEGLSSQPFARTRSAIDESRLGRTDAELLRQQRFLESDARVLTQSDVTEAVTLGESDLLRALQRLPGVSARDDYTAGLWTRGAPWGQTRAYYDGLPLFNPVHGLGLLSSLSPDAIGLASFHPGVRSASIGEGAAGVLSLTSRRAERPGLHGLADLSVTSARAALEAGAGDGSGGLVLGARRSYVDVATSLARLAGGDSAVYVPYSFLDLTARGDLRLGARTALEASGLWAEDNVRGRLLRLLQPTRGSWGNRLGRVSVDYAGASHRTRVSLGISRFDGLINPPAPTRGLFDAATAVDPSDREAPSHGSTRNQLTVAIASAEIGEASGSRRPGWAAGIQLLHYSQSFGGQLPRPYPVTVLPDTLLLDEILRVPAAWTERRWSLGGSAALETGVRLEVPDHGLDLPVVAVAPRIALRVTAPGGRATMSVAAGRSWQYTQALAPAGPSVGPDLYLTDVWLLSGDTIPAIRSDVVTVGGELSLGNSWIAEATGYVRRSAGVAVPDPEPGALTPRRPIFAEATNPAAGVEVGVRRIAGRTTASLSYTLARSTIQARGFSYPSSADRRHTMDATAMYRVTPGLRLGAAVTAGSGTPYSRVILGLACDSTGRCAGDTLALSIDAPNAERTGTYASLDLMVDWEGRMGGARVGAFLQVRNALNRGNAVTYTGSLENCRAGSDRLVQVVPGTCDRFDRGVPLLPLAGVRIAF